MSEAFDIATLGPGWEPAQSSDYLSGFDVALRIPTEVGTRTVIGHFTRIIGDQVTVYIGRIHRDYSARFIVAKYFTADYESTPYGGC